MTREGRNDAGADRDRSGRSERGARGGDAARREV